MGKFNISWGGSSSLTIKKCYKHGGNCGGDGGAHENREISNATLKVNMEVEKIPHIRVGA